MSVLEIKTLRVKFGAGAHAREVVGGISLTVNAGECVAIVGESGSGKSVSARSIVGLTGAGSRVSADALTINGRDVRNLPDRLWRGIRGRDVGFVLQDALVSLDPLRPVGKEIVEVLKLHRWGTARERHARVLELLQQVGVPEPNLRARQLPGELSGGQRQRALIASAIALDPALLIADEPTTALDVTVQAQILDLLEQTKARGKALLLISHDLAVVARLADRVAVMNGGVVVEEGPTEQVLGNPKHAYTQRLLDAVPGAHSRGTRLSPTTPVTVSASACRAAPTGKPLIGAHDVSKSYRGPDGRTRTVVRNVSFELGVGETLGVVGESGSGKTTLAKLVLATTVPDSGEIRLEGEAWSGLPESKRRARRRLLTTVYQDPLSSFDPRWSVGKLLLDALPADRYRGNARGQRVDELLTIVGLSPDLFGRRPIELSGGQRQRVAIARALAPEPAVIVCDESVSALDVSIQAQILDLLADIQTQLGVSYLFISHDLGVIHHMSDRILVMQNGRIVEEGDADAIFANPREPYTKRLLGALPQLPVTAAP